MELFKLLLPSAVCAEKELYYRADDALCNYKDGLLELKRGARVRFDTYFNCFSYAKYKQFTLIDSVSIRLKIYGSFAVKLYKKEIVNYSSKVDLLSKSFDEADYKREKLLLATVAVAESPDEIEIPFDFSRETGEGFVYIELEALSDNCLFFGGGYQTGAFVKNNVNIGVVICTYRREEYVKRNVLRIKEFTEENADCKDKLDVFVIDNGNSLAADEVVGATVIPNKNTGGSGGFTRGIIEVYKRKKYTHFLLMDDDVVFETEILRKMIGILAYAKRPEATSVGGSMLRLDKPYCQHELGARWNGVGIDSLRGNTDLTKDFDLLRNEHEEQADYSAWWCMCMPVSTVVRHGLPLPLFIKCDDVEYGIRATESLVLVNGIGVWHEDFESKYSGELEYYIKRNEAVVASLWSPEISWKQQFVKLVRSVGKQLVWHRYFVIDYIFKGFEDFLDGASFIKNTDATALHKQLRSGLLRQIPKAELETLGYDNYEDYYKFKKRKFSYPLQVATLNGYLIPTCFYRRKDREGYRLINMLLPKPSNFFMSYKELQYNPNTKCGFATSLDRKQLFIAAKKLIKMYFRLKKEYDIVAAKYRAELPVLTSMEFWINYLGLQYE